MSTQGGFGLVLKVDVGGGSMTAIAKVIDATFPVQQKEVADITSHDSTSGYREYIDTGLRELTEFTATLLWDDTQTTHARLLTLFAATAAEDFSIADPAGQEVISFTGFVRAIGRVAQMTDGYKAEVTFRPTGAPTIA